MRFSLAIFYAIALASALQCLCSSSEDERDRRYRMRRNAWRTQRWRHHEQQRRQQAVQAQTQQMASNIQHLLTAHESGRLRPEHSSELATILRSFHSNAQRAGLPGFTRQSQDYISSIAESSRQGAQRGRGRGRGRN